MRLRTYKAYSYDQAITAAKQDLGEGVRVITTRHVRKRGLVGFWARPFIEVTVELSRDVNVPSNRSPKANEATAAYAATSAAQSAKTVDMDFERLKTKRLAQALAVKLEREGRIRVDASRNERAVASTAQLQQALDSVALGSERGKGAPKMSQAPLPDVARRIVLRTEEVPEQRLQERAALLGGGSESTKPADSFVPAPSDVIKRVVTKAIKEERSGIGTFADAKDPVALREIYARLIEQEVTEELAKKIMTEIGEELGAEDARDPVLVRRAAQRHIAAMLPIDERALDVSVTKQEGRPHVVALIGPTGVGKTTTIAKLAAAARFRDGHSVGLVTTDSFRMAAVDQLRSYAEILQVPLEVVIEPDEMRGAIGRLNACDVILIDSAGRSRRDEERLDVLRQFLTSASPDETHLVLSTTSGERTMLRDADTFASLGADRVVLTKLDETDEFGVVLNVINRLGTKISFVTTGQEVPDDIERGGSDRIARLLLAGVLADQSEEPSMCEPVP